MGILQCGSCLWHEDGKCHNYDSEFYCLKRHTTSLACGVHDFAESFMVDDLKDNRDK